MPRATTALLATAAALLGAGTALAQTRPPENPEGAAVALGASSAAAGSSLSFTGSGFTKDDGSGGQMVVIKLDDKKVLGEFRAAADGALAGSVTIPPGTAAGAHWLRFLAGSGGLSGQGGTGEPPARSLTADFRVPAPAPAPGEPGAPAPGGGSPTAPAVQPRVRVRSTALRAAGRRVRVRLACVTSVACATTVTVRRGGVTLARARVNLPENGARTVRVPLTRAGRALLRRDRRVRVRVRVAPRGGPAASRTLTLTG